MQRQLQYKGRPIHLVALPEQGRWGYRIDDEALPVPRGRARVTLLAAAGMVVLPSYGGGGGGTTNRGLDTGGTGSFSTGRISGFGSVIVNAV